MAIRKAMLMKVEFVLEIARKDRRFLNDLSKDPVRTLDESGIDLSTGEALAVIDIIRGTSHSTISPLLIKHRQTWSAINQEAAASFGREVDERAEALRTLAKKDEPRGGQ